MLEAYHHAATVVTDEILVRVHFVRAQEQER